MSKEIRRLFKQKRNEEGRKIVLVDKFCLQPATFIKMKRCLGRERDIDGVSLLFSQMRLNSLAEETFDGLSKENHTDLQVCLYFKAHIYRASLKNLKQSEQPIRVLENTTGSQ